MIVPSAANEKEEMTETPTPPKRGTPVGASGQVADGRGGKITAAQWKRIEQEENAALQRIRETGVN